MTTQPIVLAEARKNKISFGNICVTEKGILFIALNMFRSSTDEKGEAWYGVAFNGTQMHAEHCVKVSDNLNQYLLDTYNENYEATVTVVA